MAIRVSGLKCGSRCYHPSEDVPPIADLRSSLTKDVVGDPLFATFPAGTKGREGELSVSKSFEYWKLWRACMT